MMGDVEIFKSLLKVGLICITSFESYLPLHQHTKLREPRIYVPVCGEEIGNWGRRRCGLAMQSLGEGGARERIKERKIAYGNEQNTS
jgi:hypothetical protein